MGGLFKSKAPEPKPVAPLPDTEDPAVKEAQRRNAAATQARSGRASTVLTTKQSRGTTAQPGTSAYSNSLLGQAN